MIYGLIKRVLNSTVRVVLHCFSRVWLRWVHFKLPNSSQYSSELGQMESAHHRLDDSGNRWVLPHSCFVLREGAGGCITSIGWEAALA